MAKPSVLASQSECKHQSIDKHQKFNNACYHIVARLSILEDAIQNSSDLQTITKYIPVLRNINDMIELLKECTTLLLSSKEGV